MPEVGSDLEFPTMIKPCPDCGEPVIEAHNSSDLDADSIFFDLEPAGKGVQLQWRDNDKLPTIAKVHEIHRIHECSGNGEPDPREVQERTMEALRTIHGKQPPFVKGSVTSEMASIMIEDYAPNDRLRVLCWLVYHVPEEGATDDELEHDLGIKHQTVSARRRDLVKAGLVEDSGRTRQTESDRPAKVWTPTPLAFRVVERVEGE